MKTIKYRISLPTAYLKGEVTHEQNFVKLKTPKYSFLPSCHRHKN